MILNLIQRKYAETDCITYTQQPLAVATIGSTRILWMEPQVYIAETKPIADYNYVIIIYNDNFAECYLSTTLIVAYIRNTHIIF